MANIYKILKLRTIPEFRLEIEEEPLFRFFAGPPMIRWFYDNELYGEIYIQDSSEYFNRTLQLFNEIDGKLSISPDVYESMEEMRKNGESSHLFKDIYNHRVKYMGSRIEFEGIYGISLTDIDSGYWLQFNSTYPSKPSYKKTYDIVEGTAIKYLLNIYLWINIKETPKHWKNRRIDYINDSYISSDILRLAKEYGKIEIRCA